MTKGKRTDWTMKQLRQEILHYAICVDTSNDEYQIEDILKDYEELLKESKSSGTIFVDEDGKEWTEDDLNELIETLQTLKKGLDRLSYY